MRIGFDMLAVQSPHHGARGIGRISANLVSALLERATGHEYVLYAHDDLPDERIPVSTRAEVRKLRPHWHLGETMAPYMDRLARTNPDGLDVLVVLSPFEKWAAYAPPSRAIGGPKMVALIHDLIPFLFQNEMVVDQELMRHYHVLEKVARYDALLSICRSTRTDCLSVLGLPPDRVKIIGGASVPNFFVPDRSAPSAAVRATLAGLGITRPFVLNVGGLDTRKNTWRLMEAFASLPDRLRASHQLVLTFAINDWAVASVAEETRRLGLEDAIVLTGEVDDETLRLLYQRCAVFTMPSLYEGFGMPTLEAMHCGAAVVAGNNSSQIEVVGDAGLLAEAGDVNDIAAKIGSLLDDPALAESLRERAPAQASTFTWDRTVGLFQEMLTDLEGRRRPASRVRFDRAHAQTPTIAFFSPLPPRKSGVSDYSALLLDELRKHYKIDLFHDPGYVPEPALANDDLMSCDSRLFDRLAASKEYHAIVYQMGNSRYHAYMYPLMMRHKGLVTLHDFCLAGYHLHNGHHRGVGFGFIADELRTWYPEDREEVERVIASWPDNWDEIARVCSSRGWYLNRRVLDAAQPLVVHSPWCAARVREGSPRYAEKVVVIPHGIHPKRVSDAQRASVRDRFLLPQDALVVASFGFVHPDKMSPEALDAFAVIARDDPGALFVFVGEEADGGAVRRHAASLGLNERVRFLGRQPAEAFAALITVTDVGVNLRMPPTNGETSGALLNLLSAGVPTVVTDVATFSDYPADVVRKVRWETEGADGLLAAIRGLTSNRQAREALGRSAWNYVDENHEWTRVGKLYVDAIERSHEETAAARGLRSRASATVR